MAIARCPLGIPRGRFLFGVLAFANQRFRESLGSVRDSKKVQEHLGVFNHMEREMNSPTDRLLTLPEVMKITAKPRTSIYLAVEQGTFPAPRKPGRRLVWLASEIDAWIGSLPRVEFAGRKAAPHA